MSSKNDTFRTIISDSGSITHSTYLTKYIAKLNKYGFYKTDIDLAFQSRSRWKPKDRESFINSCLINMNISKFILVDVKTCLANAKGKKDKKYYQSWLDRGVYWLNVDSNNRSITLRMFRDNEVKIPHGDYPQPNGLIYTVDKASDTYKTMNSNLRKQFEVNSMSVFIVKSASRQQLGDLFQRMNNGVALNFFEERNCDYSTTCETIRNLADRMAEKFIGSKLFSPDEISRRTIDGWLANVSFYTLSSGGLWSKPSHREWYDYDNSSNDTIETFAKAFTTFIDEVVGSKLKLIHHKWVLFDLFYAWNNKLNDDKILIEDSNMVQDYIDIYTKLINDKGTHFNYLKDGEKPDDTTEWYAFSKFVRNGEMNSYTRVRVNAYKSKGWNVDKYFKESTKKDPKRGATKIEKQGLAVRDNWKDNDGDSFIPETLFDGNLDAGHIIAHNHGIEKGGVTEPDNMVIEKMPKNRGKGDKETIISQ